MPVISPTTKLPLHAKGLNTTLPTAMVCATITLLASTHARNTAPLPLISTLFFISQIFHSALYLSTKGMIISASLACHIIPIISSVLLQTGWFIAFLLSLPDQLSKVGSIDDLGPVSLFELNALRIFGGGDWVATVQILGEFGMIFTYSLIFRDLVSHRRRLYKASNRLEGRWGGWRGYYDDKSGWQVKWNCFEL